MRFAKIVYSIAAVYGFIVLAPLYFLVGKIAQDNPPPITHTEFYYGFAGVALLWQVVFLMIARDPLRYRPIMPATIFEKLAFTIPVVILYALGRVPVSTLAFAMVDSLLGIGFLVAYIRTRNLGHRNVITMTRAA